MVSVKAPDWIENGSITLRLTELNPHAVEALIETLRDASEEDDERVRLLLRLWDALTGDE
jgi:hypothetical protein